MRRSTAILVFLVQAAFIIGVSVVASTVCIKSGLCSLDLKSVKLNPMEAFGYAGILVTIMAFVAAFSIALMTTDSASIAAVAKLNAERIKESLDELTELESRLSNVDVRSARAQSYIEILDLYFSELNRSSNQDDRVLFFLELVEDRLSIGGEIKEALLLGREEHRRRSARLEGIRAIAQRLRDPEASVDLGAAFPELMNAVQEGDLGSKTVLTLLVDSGILGREEAERARRMIRTSPPQ